MQLTDNTILLSLHRVIHRSHFMRIVRSLLFW